MDAFEDLSVTSEEIPGLIAAANCACDSDEVADWVNVIDHGSVVVAPGSDCCCAYWVV